MNNDGNWGLTNSSLVWGYAGVIAVALIGLAILRVFFASFNVSAGAGVK